MPIEEEEQWTEFRRFLYECVRGRLAILSLLKVRVVDLEYS